VKKNRKKKQEEKEEKYSAEQKGGLGVVPSLKGGYYPDDYKTIGRWEGSMLQNMEGGAIFRQT